MIHLHLERQQGVALLAVLLLLALLTALATTVVALSLSERWAARRLEEAVQADLIADSAIRITLLRLLATSQVERVSLQQLNVFDIPVTVLLEQEAGRVDLNFASEKLLAAAFMSAGWRPGPAASMAARIIDWRDEDDMRQPQGAERMAYSAAKLSYGPRNGHFESVEELRQVMGASDLDPQLLDAFTVYTQHQQEPVAAWASELVRRALESLHDEQAGDMVSARAVADRDVLRVRACAQIDRYARCRLAVVRLTGSVRDPFQVFVWNSY